MILIIRRCSPGVFVVFWQEEPEMKNLYKIDPEKLPLRRAVRWVLDNEPEKKYLVMTEGCLAVLLALSIFFYVR